jgi:glycosyltransferase involved in cell wall biosynthesis
MSLKIAIDARKWRDYGIGTYVRNLVRHLAPIDRETTYFLFCNRADEATLRDLAENFVPVVDDSGGYSLREHVSIPAKLRRLGADLLHSPHYVLPLLCRRRAVVTIHDCIHLLFPEYLPSRMALTYAHRMMGHAIARSALVFTVSEASRRDILRFYPHADADRLQVVPNAIDAAILEHPGEEEMERVKERYQIRGRFVLYAGNIKPHKNLERLIAAFGQLKQRPGHEDLKLLIIGDEINKYGSLRRRVESAGVRHDVRFFGFVPESTLAALYRLASVFAFPSLYEGFGLPPLEAMASGTPVVTSRISSLPEVVGDAAVLVDPYSEDDIADGIERVLGDDALRAALIEKGHARVSQFSWERSVRAIHGGYMKVLGVSVAAQPVEQVR